MYICMYVWLEVYDIFATIFLCLTYSTKSFIPSPLSKLTKKSIKHSVTFIVFTK